AIDAVMEPDFNIGGLQATTNPVTPMIIINGPIRQKLGINCSSGALGPGWRANATIGRALRLVLVNIGGATPGLISKATLAQPGKYTMCLGENEEESPWDPLHVERGLSPEQSSVTLVGATGTFNMHCGSRGADNILTIMAHSISALGTVNMSGLAKTSGGETLIVICPPHARVFAEAGLSKNDIKRILWERGRLPIDWYPPNAKEDKIAAGAVIDGMGLLVYKPEDMMIVVAGGPGGLHSTFIPSLGPVSLSVTKPIRE
ncbi:MAG: UGSC family (seleno)protein, partial [Dehalococcoidia bacterium]|nr:UGSC family (seleno)protein [Dehalococcoidia bacterium]